MTDAKIALRESSDEHGKIAEGKDVSGKSIPAKSFPTKSSGAKSSDGISSRQNQSGKIVSGEIHSTNKSPTEIGSGKIAQGETAGESIDVQGGEPTIWLDTLSDEMRKLLVHDGVSKLHYVWAAMKQRCYNPKSRNYKWYGARGVKVCKSWLRWQNFKLWALRNGYDPEAPYGECTLDRIDVDGNYEPSNCRWVSFKEQMNNRQWNKSMQNEAEPEPTKEKVPVVATDEDGNVVHDFDDIDDAAAFFRPGRVDSARSYIKRAIRRGDKCYKLYWSRR